MTSVENMLESILQCPSCPANFFYVSEAFSIMLFSQAYHLPAHVAFVPDRFVFLRLNVPYIFARSLSLTAYS
jgi:hypothetical protein